nr:ADP-ribosylglycohydrolase family protein [Neobacillus piezotolerans]
MIGLAVGDAAGVATEFMSPDEIERKYGSVKEILGGAFLDLNAARLRMIRPWP